MLIPGERRGCGALRRAVLTTHRIRPGGGAYFLTAVNEAPGRWLGSGCRALCLDGEVRAADFQAVLAGRDPRHADALNPAQRRVRVAGLDLTFSAPKSVSVLFGIADAKTGSAVAEAHGRAVADAVSYLERVAFAARRTEAGRRYTIATSGALAAGFVHRFSRSLDPHLHTHVVVANIVEGVDGRWSALDARRVFAELTTAGALYQAELRAEIGMRLGLRFASPVRGLAELSGFDPEHLYAYSRRARDIAAYAQRNDLAGPHSMRNASDATRPPRDVTARFEDLQVLWRERARSLGLHLGHSSVARASGRSDPATDLVGRIYERNRAAVARALAMARDDGLVPSRAADMRAAAVRAWCSVDGRGASVATVEALADRTLASVDMRRAPRFALAPDVPGRVAADAIVRSIAPAATARDAALVRRLGDDTLARAAGVLGSKWDPLERTALALRGSRGSRDIQDGRRSVRSLAETGGELMHVRSLWLAAQRVGGNRGGDLQAALLKRYGELRAQAVRRTAQLAEQTLRHPPVAVRTVLGAPPLERGQRTAWLRAAVAIEGFRERWNIRQEPALGPAPARADHADRLAHRVLAVATVDAARRDLDRSVGRLIEPSTGARGDRALRESARSGHNLGAPSAVSHVHDRAVNVVPERPAQRDLQGPRRSSPAREALWTRGGLSR